MERRASLVLVVLVQSSLQFHLEGEHYLRPEGLKVGLLYQRSTSEFMDFDPEQNSVGGSLFMVEFPVSGNVNDLSINSGLPDDGLVIEPKGPVLVIKNEVIKEVKYVEPDTNMAESESFITDEIDKDVYVKADGETNEGHFNRLKRDLGYVDSTIQDFAPRRLRGGRIRF